MNLRGCILMILTAAVSVVQSRAQKLSLYELTCEYRTHPIGIEASQPRLSWKIKSTESNVIQTAYEVRVSKQSGRWNKDAAVWQSGKVQRSQSILVPYEGASLESGQRYYWQVRVWDNHGNKSAWSKVQWWEMGLLRTSDRKAKWIENPYEEHDEQVVWFRREFETGRSVKRARLYITANGIYQASINGKQVSNDLFAPGWTAYNKRLQYQVYDVTEMLRSGKNAIGVTVGEGWYKGTLLGTKNFYGNRVGLFAQLELEYDGEKKEVVSTDNNWLTTNKGPIVRSGLYSGEIYDAGKAMNGWDAPGFDTTGWLAVSLSQGQRTDHFVAQSGPPVLRQEEIRPVKVIRTPKGEKVIDFGQNIAGRVRFSVSGKKGDTVRIQHAEILDEQGNFYTANLRHAKQELIYILKGQGVESYEPCFTFQGFRFIKITGAGQLIDTGNIRAVAIYSDMKKTGTFHTSDSLINQLQQNITWGQKGNFLDIPTDCPQRDERLGWTGDAQVFFNTAAFNRDVQAFFRKWLTDLRAEQLANGGIPGIVPNIWGEGEQNIGQAGWADAVTIVPWGFYMAYGDTAILKENYPAMLKWVSYIQSRSTGHLWNKSWHHGDWLYFMPQDVWDKNPAFTDKTLIAQAFYANTLQLTINVAHVLGYVQDVAKYSSLLEKVKEAFVSEFVTGSGALRSHTQTAYVLALQFDLLPQTLRQQAAARLADLIAQYDDHLSTGFLGTPHLCHVLSRYGFDELAFKLLTQKTYPSWLYPVTKGATTIWERWDGIRPNGGLQDVQMNSFNHYAYGAIGDWMYRHIAGIQPSVTAPGYKEFVIAPKIGGGLTSASASLESPYGTIRSAWKLDGDTVLLEIEAPANTKARIVLPEGVEGTLLDKQEILFSNEKTVGSGIHRFRYSLVSQKFK